MKLQFGLAAVAALTLAGCNDTGSLQERAVGVILGETGAPTKAERFPRFVPLLQSGKGPALDVSIAKNDLRGGFLKETSQGTIENWLGNDGVSLVFDRGLLQGTRGLGAGLLGSDVAASANAVLGGRSGQVNRTHTFLDGNDRAVAHSYVCTISNEGSETIQLDTGATPTRRMSETCINADERFTNTYWVNTRSNSIVKSKQWAGEFIGELSITTVYNF